MLAFLHGTHGMILLRWPSSALSGSVVGRWGLQTFCRISLNSNSFPAPVCMASQIQDANALIQAWPESYPKCKAVVAEVGWLNFQIHEPSKSVMIGNENIWAEHVGDWILLMFFFWRSWPSLFIIDAKFLPHSHQRIRSFPRINCCPMRCVHERSLAHIKQHTWHQVIERAVSQGKLEGGCKLALSS